MKKSFLILAVSACISAVALVSCTSSAEKVENAQEEVKDANADLAKANQEYLSDVDAYRKETANRIAANDKTIAELKAKTALEKKEAREEYNKKIAALEEKNTNMKKKMEDYQPTNKEKWESFKSEFGHDMDELGNSFKDLTINNVK